MIHHKWIISIIASLLALISFNVHAAFSEPNFKTLFGNEWDLQYYSPRSIEAGVEFSHFVEIRSSSRPERDLAVRRIHQQLTHLFGPMERYEPKSVPKMNHDIVITSMQRDESRGVFRVNYDYKGDIAVSEAVGKQMTLLLPRDPDRIYGQAVVFKNNQRYFPCTDKKYTEEKYFWYFWSPDRDGCQLVEGEHYDRFTVKVTQYANTKETYPEYERLINEAGEIPVHILIGMDNPFKSTDPSRSDDIAVKTYNKLSDLLSQRGYTSRKWSEEEIKKFMQNSSNKIPAVTTFTKEFPRATMKVRLFFGPSGEMQSKPFHYFFKDALEKASVMVYAGHSGLGEYVAPQSIAKSLGASLKPPKDRYQIWFFNSCSSYPYFNRDYFDLKMTSEDPEGTKNLDIITNGLSTYFYALTPSTLVLINSVEDYAKGYLKRSYQSMINRGDSMNFMAVNGDKDNPTSH